MAPLLAEKDVIQNIPGAELYVIESIGHHISMVFLDELENCIMKNVQKTGP